MTKVGAGFFCFFAVGAYIIVTKMISEKRTNESMREERGEKLPENQTGRQKPKMHLVKG